MVSPLKKKKRCLSHQARNLLNGSGIIMDKVNPGNRFTVIPDQSHHNSSVSLVATTLCNPVVQQHNTVLPKLGYGLGTAFVSVTTTELLAVEALLLPNFHLSFALLQTQMSLMCLVWTRTPRTLSIWQIKLKGVYVQR